MVCSDITTCLGITPVWKINDWRKRFFTSWASRGENKIDCLIGQVIMFNIPFIVDK